MKKQYETELTVKQAIEEGYTLCGYDSGDSWQSLTDLKDVDEETFNSVHPLVLANKEGESPFVTADSIKEMIADSCESEHGNDTGDDTEQVYDAIMALDFSQTADMVNKALSEIVTYRLTKIKLIP